MADDGGRGLLGMELVFLGRRHAEMAQKYYLWQTNRMRPPSHPGRLLKMELQTRRLSANRLAIALGVPSGQITHILNGRRSIIAEMAVRLGYYFGNSPRLWLDLQSQYDIAVIEREWGKEIAAQVRRASRAA